MMTVVDMAEIDPTIVGTGIAMAEIAIVVADTAEIDTMIVGMVATVIVEVDMVETGTTIVDTEIVSPTMIAEVAIVMETEIEDVTAMMLIPGVAVTVDEMQEASLIEMNGSQVREQKNHQKFQISFRMQKFCQRGFI